MWSQVWHVWRFSRDKKMCVFHEQQIYVKIEKFVTETFEMLKIAFRAEAMSRTQTYEWWKHFKEGQTSVDDDLRSGQPSTSKTDDEVAKAHEVIHSNRRLTVREVAEEVSQKQCAMEILSKIWACIAFQPNLCHACWRRIVPCPWLLCPTRDDCPSTASVLSRSRTSWLFSVSKAQINAERPLFSVYWGNQSKFASGAGQFSYKSFPGMLQNIEEMLATVHTE